jgi:hypothetical protein
MAGMTTSDAVADLLTERGVDRAVKAALTGVGGTRSLSWIEPKPPRPLPVPRPVPVPVPRKRAQRTKRPATKAKRAPRAKRPRRKK